MVEKVDSEIVTIVTQEKERDIDRYYLTIFYTLAMRFFINNNPHLKTKFVGAITKLRRNFQDSLPLTPDMVLQVTNTNNKLLGIPIEIKSSISDDEDTYEKLKKMERYNDSLDGWDTTKGIIDNEVIVFSPYALDSGKVLQVLKNKLLSGELNFKKDFLIWEWSFVNSSKSSQEEDLLVRQIYGDLSKHLIPNFENQLSRGIIQNINDYQLIIQKERNLFIKQEPPVEYTMNTLWEIIFPKIFDEKAGSVVSKLEITQIINEYFTDNLLSNSNGTQFKVCSDWIEKALESFVKIHLAKKIGEKYEIQFDQRTRNIKNLICTRMASMEIKEGKHISRLAKNKPLDLQNFSKGKHPVE